MDGYRSRRRRPATHYVVVAGLALLGCLAAIGGGTSAASAASPTPPLIAGKAVCARATKLHYASCNSRVVTNEKGQVIQNTSPAGYGPGQFQTAYGLTAAATLPTSAVVAIVDAYHDPTAKADLDVYSQTYGLPVIPVCSGSSNAGCFRQVNQTGGSTPPATNGDWALEISLDVQTVHAVCPNCGILLVEASSNYDEDLYPAEDYAAAHSTIVSNSWGGGESSSENTEDVHFNHPGVAITASSGDYGYGGGVEYPSSSKYVTSVGGTTLTLNADDTRAAETVWNGAGSGCSAFEPKPSWQTDTGCANRTDTDVSADADPETGAAVYDTTNPYHGWMVVGGTSLASPLVASVYALGGAIGSSDYPAAYPYAHTSSLFDVTSGSNGACPPGAAHYLCTGGVGYDGPTGLGTPIGTAAFTGAGGGGSGPAPTVTSFTPASGPVGTEVDIQGTSFTGATGVTFNGTPDAGFVVDADTEITAHVPTGATTGPISVRTPDGTGTSSVDFQVTTEEGNPPTVTSFTPASGPVGTEVDIQGTSFTGASGVTFNGTPDAGFVVDSDTEITAHVPTGATTGPISVRTPDGTGTSAASFGVVPAPPRIDSFTPTSGPVGTTVTIDGSNLTGATAVSFGGADADTYDVVDDSTISAKVPAGATTGPIEVTTAGGTATSETPFTVTTPLVRPTVTSFTPRAGHPGSTVEILGQHFTGITRVYLGWTRSTFTVLSPTEIRVTVPHVYRGFWRWRVSNAAGTGISRTFFMSS